MRRWRKGALAQPKMMGARVVMFLRMGKEMGKEMG